MAKKTMSKNFHDKELTCKDCGRSFTFTSGEQEFYASRELIAPKRCKPCRRAKKAQMSNTGLDF